MKPHILIIGGITNSKAKYPDGIRQRFGGGVSYGGKVSLELGVKTSIITIGADDIAPAVNQLKKLGADVFHIQRPQSSNFSNDYTGKVRKLQVRSLITDPLTINEIESANVNPDAIILFPLFNEIPAEIITNCKNKFIYLDVSGYTRKVLKQNDQSMYPLVQSDWKTMDKFRNKVDVIKLSEDDIRSIKFPSEVKDNVNKLLYLSANGFKVTILTRGHKPTLVADNGKIYTVPTLKVNAVDSAGAGEAFGVGFVLARLNQKDILESIAFANACAGFHVARQPLDFSEIDNLSKTLIHQRG